MANNATNARSKLVSALTAQPTTSPISVAGTSNTMPRIAISIQSVWNITRTRADGRRTLPSESVLRRGSVHTLLNPKLETNKQCLEEITVVSEVREPVYSRRLFKIQPFFSIFLMTITLLSQNVMDMIMTLLCWNVLDLNGWIHADSCR